jgi:hypothetical protein
VVALRTVKRTDGPPEEDITHGEDIDFHAEGIAVTDPVYAFSGGTTTLSPDETFELVLSNGLVIRLQCFDVHSRREWMRRLTDLVRYWRLRLKADLAELESTRKQNLRLIGVDRGNESDFGDWIQRYQLNDAVSSPEIYNLCRLVGCRSILVPPPCT